VTVLYLYGFAPEDAALPEHGLLGVADAEVELLRLDGFMAVIGRVPAASFSGDALEANSGDVAWMAEQGLRHEQVVGWFVDHAAILPSRLLTLFSAEEGLRAAVARDRDRIADGLRRFADLREWDLKVSYDADRLSDHLGEVSEDIARLDREIAAASPGKAFLLRKKRDDLARTETRATARRLARELLDHLAAHARDVAVLPAIAENAPVILNAALLVPRGAEGPAREDAAEAAGRLEALGLDVTFTGPWAPYRFLDDDRE
jgi:hypothetical protein